MFAPEMPLSLASRRNEGQGRQSASNMARCLIGSRKWLRLKSSSLRTRQSRRWIVPKGWPIKRLTPSKSAAREAFEEAGVRGKIGARPIGNFRYKKAADENGAEADCEVKVFPLLVKRQSAAWPESAQRVAQWVDPDKAISLIREPELKSLVAAFAKRAAIAASKLIYWPGPWAPGVAGARPRPYPASWSGRLSDHVAARQAKSPQGDALSRRELQRLDHTRCEGLTERAHTGLSGRAKRQTREGRLSDFFVLNGE